jgi:hypothetical protein
LRTTNHLDLPGMRAEIARRCPMKRRRGATKHLRQTVVMRAMVLVILLFIGRRAPTLPILRLTSTRPHAGGAEDIAAIVAALALTIAIVVRAGGAHAMSATSSPSISKLPS